MKVVRDSKFRHVFGEPWKVKFEDLRVSGKISESTGVRGNSKFICFPWESGGGGSMAVLPIEKTGRVARDTPLITGHGGPVLDFEFNPFDNNMLISASEDSMVKLWQIPDGGLTGHMKESLADLKGHQKKVSFCTCNPVANGILATSAFDMTVKVWSMAEQEVSYSIDVPDQVMHLKWNMKGDLLAATCKDKKMRIIDPRASKFVGEVKPHEGSKAVKVEWLGGASSPSDENFKMATTGFTSQAQRQLGIWDMRKFGGEEAEFLNMLDLDNGTGCLFPFFDPGTQLLYLAGKGDANVRYFEMDEKDPFCHYVDMYSTTVPQKGFEFMSKRCVDVTKHEVARALKLESSAMSIVSFKVPRKSKEFQEDLFPDCPAGVPAMTTDEFVGGAEGRYPVLRSMAPGAETVVQSAAPAMAVVSVKDLKKQLAEAEARIASLEKENELLKKELAELKK